MSKKKVLIIIADIGNGHRSAANALTSVFEEKYKDQYEVRTVDLYLEADVEPFNSGNESYTFLSQNRAYESLSNLLWKITNSKIFFPFFFNYLNKKLYAETEKIVKRESPDLVVSAYPLTCPMIGTMLKKGYSFRYAVVITDLITIHRSWADTMADLIFSPTTDAVSSLIRFGVKSKKIIYPLFPLRPELQNQKSKEEVFSELNLNPNKPTILLTGGGLGTKAITSAIQRLSKRNDLQLVVVAGKLDAFRTQLEKKYELNPNVKVLGFVKNMQDLINATDILVGKPGATTVMEVELFGKKAIYTRFIGEHDSGNVPYALRDPKVRYISDNWEKLDEAIDSLLESEHREASKPRRDFNESERIVDELVKLLAF